MGGAAVEEIRREALDGIQQIERELIVRDFVAVLNDGGLDELLPFLTEDVVYRPSRTRHIVGRRELLGMVSGIRSRFAEWSTALLTVAVTGDTVLTEQVLHLRLPDGEACDVLGFSSFRLEGSRICAWHQVHA
jgi:limonene-1,2-epoxide hydrolase